MARILLKTRVSGNYLDVMSKFDLALFKALAPKQAKMEIVEFTGSKKGDRVHIRFTSPIKADWTSDITSDHQDDQSAHFVDEGVVMPFGLEAWHHKHIVSRIDDSTSMIVDDINFKGKNLFLTLLLYPVFLIGFYPRKRIYREYFGQ